MEKKQPLIYDLSFSEIEDRMVKIGQPSFRAKQIWVALYQTFRSTPQEISTLPKDIRVKLDQSFSFNAFVPVRSVVSIDGQTIKTLFQLRDGNHIETVCMHYENRHTLCLSSQSGCGIGCSFCATGQMGFGRNLSSGEIIAQVIHFARHLSQTADRVTNIVLMGMGEPFENYDNVMEALNRLNDSEAFGLGARRFTVSTVGLVPKIIRFADEETQYNLAISLHTVDDNLRSDLIPINRKYPVDKLLSACRYYLKKTNRRVTFEVALIQGVNDSIEDAEALAKKIRGMICHINLIPLNPTNGFTQRPTASGQVNAFCATLEAHNITCTVRLRRGIEIQAGCGQLAVEK